MKYLMVNIYALIMCFLVSVRTGYSFNSQFLDSVLGEIQGSNFSYFSLQQPGLLSLELISHNGDCDIYISQFKTKPTFELDSYCLESSSCGLDKIIVPKSFKRPLAIGVYGHPSHEVSTYTLNIYQISETSDDYESDELYAAAKYANFEGTMDKNSFQGQSSFYYCTNLIFNFFTNLWNLWFSDNSSNEFHPLVFCFEFLFELLYG